MVLAFLYITVITSLILTTSSVTMFVKRIFIDGKCRVTIKGSSSRMALFWALRRSFFVSLTTTIPSKDESNNTIATYFTIIFVLSYAISRITIDNMTKMKRDYPTTVLN